MEKRNSIYYFISDVHLGLDVKNPLKREKKLVRVLEGVPLETEAVFLMGDIFDFWYEYKYV
ncbi:MAG TPA: UDP-2,3-diacylglucosamine diphosphatase, partial [Rikenellaceae bacterium]|nr:UDP-2,3-diacylglucosamine diphosphatase [Rikenellaceae bacterium]